MYKKNNHNQNTNYELTTKLEIKCKISLHRKHKYFWSKTKENARRENLLKRDILIKFPSKIKVQYQQKYSNLSLLEVPQFLCLSLAVRNSHQTVRPHLEIGPVINENNSTINTSISVSYYNCT